MRSSFYDAIVRESVSLPRERWSSRRAHQTAQTFVSVRRGGRSEPHARSTSQRGEWTRVAFPLGRPRARRQLSTLANDASLADKALGRAVVYVCVRGSKERHRPSALVCNFFALKRNHNVRFFFY